MLKKSKLGFAKFWMMLTALRGDKLSLLLRSFALRALACFGSGISARHPTPMCDRCYFGLS